MKKLITKLFLFICAGLAIFESMFFFMVTFRRIPAQKVISFYTFVSQTPKALRITLGVAIFFLSLGIILFFLALRVRRPQKVFLIREKGEVLRVPVDTIRDFIDQILSQSPYMSDFDTMISSKRERMNIDIFSSFKQAVPIRQEVSRVRAVLREEIERVFGFTNFKINFQAKGINIEQKTEGFIPQQGRKEVENLPLEQGLSLEAEEESNNENIIKDIHLKEKLRKKMPWKR